MRWRLSRDSRRVWRLWHRQADDSRQLYVRLALRLRKSRVEGIPSKEPPLKNLSGWEFTIPNRLRRLSHREFWLWLQSMGSILVLL
jgi:hypothetical protein